MAILKTVSREGQAPLSYHKIGLVSLGQPGGWSTVTLESFVDFADRAAGRPPRHAQRYQVEVPYADPVPFAYLAILQLPEWGGAAVDSDMPLGTVAPAVAEDAPPPVTLAVARAQTWQRIKAARDAAEFGPFVWDGHIFDGDAISLSRLSQALEAARDAKFTGDAGFSQPWKLADNTWVTLTADQVFQVYRARGQNTLNSHLHAEALRAQIYAETTTTAEQLDAITWSST